MLVEIASWLWVRPQDVLELRIYNKNTKKPWFARKLDTPLKPWLLVVKTKRDGEYAFAYSSAEEIVKHRNKIIERLKEAATDWSYQIDQEDLTNNENEEVQN